MFVNLVAANGCALSIDFIQTSTTSKHVYKYLQEITTDFLFTESMYPRFAEPIPNVTVTVGRDALLACVVDNLQGFKVSYFFYLLLLLMPFLRI